MADLQVAKCSVLYVPRLSYNLFSVLQKMEKLWDSGKPTVFNKRLVAVATKAGELYYLNCFLLDEVVYVGLAVRLYVFTIFLWKGLITKRYHLKNLTRIASLDLRSRVLGWLHNEMGVAVLYCTDPRVYWVPALQTSSNIKHANIKHDSQIQH